jgi:SAM-dependent methyltransferase
MDSFKIDWGMFSLVEFIVSNSNQIGSEFQTCLDIGSGAGVHSQILRKVGLSVTEVDKYSTNPRARRDLLTSDFGQQFDIIFCSHVIEHQRNVGRFLDRIFDLLSENGVLLITAPKHDAQTMIEGHLNCFYTSYFIQHLIHSGFNLKAGKYLSCAGIENSAIVRKDADFSLVEREEDGFRWTEAHQARSFIPLNNQKIDDRNAFFYNCESFRATSGNSINFQRPNGYREKGIRIHSDRWGIEFTI